MLLSSNSHFVSFEGSSASQNLYKAGVSKIPNELLAEIFKLAVPRPITISPTSDADDLPWALFGICKKWRQIVTGMPELWTNVVVDYEDDPLIPIANFSDPEFVTRVAHETLLRSGNAPISLEIYSRKYNMDDQTPLINLAVLHAHRIKHLKLVIFEQALHKLITLPPLDFRLLAYLSITYYDRDEENTSCTVFEKAPLKVVEFDLYDWLPTSRGSSSVHLAYLSISCDFDLTPIKAHEILKGLPSLVFLQIPLSSNEELEEMDQISPATYPSLQTLFLNSSQPELLPAFFKPLTLPHITRLEITPSAWAPQVDNLEWDFSIVFSKISSFPNLDTFAITLPIPEDYDMDSFFLSLPGLVALTLPEISEPILRSISSGNRLPNLQTLQVPVSSKTLSMHLASMRDRVEPRFVTQGIISERDWEDYLESNTSENERLLIEDIDDQGLLELIPYRENYAQIGEFVPPDLEPWN